MKKAKENPFAKSKGKGEPDEDDMKGKSKGKAKPFEKMTKKKEVKRK